MSIRTIQLPGDIIGPFRIVAPLGGGGTAMVYLARASDVLGLKRPLVALKLINRHAFDSPTGLKAFRTEASLGTRLHHPNIVRVHDFDVIGDGFLYLLMEWVRGCDLTQILVDRRRKGSPFPLGFCCGVARSVALALEYAHTCTDEVGRRLCVLHNDLKPGNILLSNKGLVKVADFGIGSDATGQVDGGFTGFAGTPRFMPPERWSKEGPSAGPASDLFSLGCVLFEMLFLRPFFEDPNGLPGDTYDRAYLEQRLSGLRAPGEPVAGLLVSLLHPDMDRRPSEAREVAQILKPLAWSPEEISIFLQGEFGFPYMADIDRLVEEDEQRTLRGAVPETLINYRVPDREGGEAEELLLDPSVLGGDSQEEADYVPDGPGDSGDSSDEAGAGSSPLEGVHSIDHGAASLESLPEIGAHASARPVGGASARLGAIAPWGLGILTLVFGGLWLLLGSVELVVSEPLAAVMVDGERVGEGSQRLYLSRLRDHEIQIDAPGFESTRLSVPALHVQGRPLVVHLVRLSALEVKSAPEVEIYVNGALWGRGPREMREGLRPGTVLDVRCQLDGVEVQSISVSLAPGEIGSVQCGEPPLAPEPSDPGTSDGRVREGH